MQSFRYTVLYRQGAENILPDALSRIEQVEAKPGPDPGAGEEDLPTRPLAHHIRTCHELELREGIGTGDGALAPEYVRAAGAPTAESAENPGGLTLAYALNPTNWQPSQQLPGKSPTTGFVPAQAATAWLTSTPPAACWIVANLLAWCLPSRQYPGPSQPSPYPPG